VCSNESGQACSESGNDRRVLGDNRATIVRVVSDGENRQLLNRVRIDGTPWSWSTGGVSQPGSLSATIPALPHGWRKPRFKSRMIPGSPSARVMFTTTARSAARSRVAEAVDGVPDNCSSAPAHSAAAVSRARCLQHATQRDDQQGAECGALQQAAARARRGGADDDFAGIHEHGGEQHRLNDATTPQTMR